MKIAFLSDIHANFPALSAALASARQRGAERIIVAGDVVGEGPHPVEVVRHLAQGGFEAVFGNQDRRVLALGSDRRRIKKLLQKKKRKKGVQAWTALQLGEEERSWLSNLPSELSFKVGNVDVLVVHGSTISDADYIYPSITAPALRAKLGERRPSLLICGHSHIPFTKRIAGVQIVNCGSVGDPIDGDPRGTYALVDFNKGRLVLSRIIRFKYSHEHVTADCVARGMPGGGVPPA